MRAAMISYGTCHHVHTRHVIVGAGAPSGSREGVGAGAILAALAVTVVVLAFRFVAGRPLVGRRRTDATWLRPARLVFAPLPRWLPGGRAMDGWAALPGWQHTACRLTGTALLVGYVTHPIATLAAVAATLAALVAGYVAVRYRQGRPARMPALTGELLPAGEPCTAVSASGSVPALAADPAPARWPAGLRKGVRS
jgi:hypothetical protein